MRLQHTFPDSQGSMASAGNTQTDLLNHGQTELDLGRPEWKVWAPPTCPNTCWHQGHWEKQHLQVLWCQWLRGWKTTHSKAILSASWSSSLAGWQVLTVDGMWPTLGGTLHVHVSNTEESVPYTSPFTSKRRDLLIGILSVWYLFTINY